jgi:hypothetical protein
MSVNEHKGEHSAYGWLPFTTRSLSLGALTFQGVSPTAVARCAQLGAYYDAEDLKRFAPAKRYALVACFLIEAHKTILDYLPGEQ